MNMSSSVLNLTGDQIVTVNVKEGSSRHVLCSKHYPQGKIDDARTMVDVGRRQWNICRRGRSRAREGPSDAIVTSNYRIDELVHQTLST